MIYKKNTARGKPITLVPDSVDVSYFFFFFFFFFFIYINKKQLHYRFNEPASVAKLDATGDQEVAGSTPAQLGNILLWRLIMKKFLRSFSPFR